MRAHAYISMIFAVVLPDELVRYIFTLLQPTAVGGMLQVCKASRLRLFGLRQMARWMRATLRWAELAQARCQYLAQQLAQHGGGNVRRVFKPIPALSAQAMWRCCVILPQEQGGHVCNATICGGSTTVLRNHLRVKHAQYFAEMRSTHA